MSQNTTQAIDVAALLRLKNAHHQRQLTRHQYRTLRGQVMAGDPSAAMRGLQKILTREGQKCPIQN